MEMVGDINLVVPNLMAIFVARSVADQLSKPLYKCQLDAKALPYLDQEPKVMVAGKQYVC
jgi:H+/Cl- antiporter ClcA